MATFVVTNTNDSGSGSLRSALIQAGVRNGADNIVFDSSLLNQTILVKNSALQIIESLSKKGVTIDGDIDGDGKGDITISGGGTTRIFDIAGSYSAIATFKHLKLVKGASDEGAAIYGRSGSIGELTITDCTFSNNQASYGAGALYIGGGNVTITNTLFTGNHAGAYGGAIRNNGELTLINSTLSGNTAGGGAYSESYATAPAILQESGSLTIINSTIVYNHTDRESGGAGISIKDGSAVSIINTVVANNTFSSANSVQDVDGTIDIATNSFFTSAPVIATNINSTTNGPDPGLQPLADNGGSTLTHLPDGGSPLIDAGDNGAVTGITEDANGNARVSGGTVDIGAVERQPIVVTTEKDVVNANDGLLSLREAIAAANANSDLDTIAFADNLAGKTIVLRAGELFVTEAVNISGDVDGDGKADITISGNDKSRVFNLDRADVDLKSLTLTNGNGSQGGAVFVINGSLDMMDCTIKDSRANYGGGGLYLDYTTATLTNSLIANNTVAYGNGGGVYIYGGKTSILNSTIDGNAANAMGGGLFTGSSNRLSIVNSTITRNSSDASGNYVASGAGLAVNNRRIELSNTVVAENNSTSSGQADDIAGEIDKSTNSLFGSSASVLSGDNNSFDVSDIGLGQLLDNGGTVLTRSPLDASVLINAGSNALLPPDIFDLDGDGNTTEALPLDARGGSRVVGASVDVGAVEQIGVETINGTSGADIIIGGRGADILSGLGGDDTINGGSGKDQMNGGGGRGDVLSYADSSVRVRINLSTEKASGGDANGDTFTGFENILGSAKGDLLTGDSGRNRIDGGDGNDLIQGLAGGDRLIGGAGLNTLSYEKSNSGVSVNLLDGSASGGHANGDVFFDFQRLIGSAFGDRLRGDENENTLRGGDGDDVIFGGGKVDRISGGAGDDQISGGTGHDLIAGGAGADTIVLTAVINSDDFIKRFNGGEDVLQVSASEFGGGLVAGALAPGRFAANLTGEAGDGSDRFILNTATGELFFDADGNAAGAAVLIATFTGGIPALSAGDFNII